MIGGHAYNVMMRIPYDRSFKFDVDRFDFTGQYEGKRIAIAFDERSYPDDKPVPVYFRFDSVAVENASIADFDLTWLEPIR